MYPDAEKALIAYLGDLGLAVTSTPPDLQDKLPVLRIQRIGGSSEDGVSDYPEVNIQAFTARDSADPRASHDLMATVRNRMDNILGLSVAGGGLLDRATLTTGPIETPWPDAAIAVVQATFRLTTRGI
jgi:hypothetical protein